RLRLRHGEPDRGHLVRDHQPEDQVLVSVAELEAHEVALESATGGLWRDAFRRLVRNPAAILGALLVAMFIVAAAFAPLLAPYGPKEQNLLLIARGCCPGPSHHHWLGVDQLGRDVYSRILYGARFSLIIGIVSVSIGLSVGLVLGSLAGYLGGFVDSLIMRCMDVMLAIPGLLFAIGIVAMLGPGLYQIMVAIGVVNVPIFARLLRGSVLAQRENDFVLAARAVGVRRPARGPRPEAPRARRPVPGAEGVLVPRPAQAGGGQCVASRCSRSTICASSSGRAAGPSMP